MANKIKIPVFCMVCLLLFAMLSGCGSDPKNYAQVQPDGTVRYDTDDAVDPMNYTLYVNKEITLITNILATHTGNGDNVIKGKYPAADESISVATDLDLVAEAIESVETMHPPTDYEDDREAILIAMLAAQDSLTNYKAALDGEADYDLRDCVELMEGDYVNLTGKMHATYWE